MMFFFKENNSVQGFYQHWKNAQWDTVDIQNTTEREDAKVSDHLFQHRKMNVVYTMDEATLFDSVFNYLQKIKIDTLEKPDNLHVITVLEQAKENVKAFGPACRIDSLALGRGFLNGKVRWAFVRKFVMHCLLNIFYLWRLLRDYIFLIVVGQPCSTSSPAGIYGYFWLSIRLPASYLKIKLAILTDYA